MMKTNETTTTISTLQKRLWQFFLDHPEIDSTHGWDHAMAVHQHAIQAIQADPDLSPASAIEIEAAALLHDVDDSKYFDTEDFAHARQLLKNLSIDSSAVIAMIATVSCSQNGNQKPADGVSLIPRWADRLEAIGKIGVLRCYEFAIGRQEPLASENTPRPRTTAQVWNAASPQRFARYTGKSTDMMSHYYDKLLHLARPDDGCTNGYILKQRQVRLEPILEVCLRYGRTGQVDVDYIRSLV